MKQQQQHTHRAGLWGWISTIFHLHGHSHDERSLTTDPAFTLNQEGIRTIWIALAALTATSIIQVIIVSLSGSVALLADTVHNIGDALNSLPLLAAFYLARRTATRRYTYGFGRAEDVVGVLIVLSIAVSAVVVFWQSLQKLLNPEPMRDIPWVAAAAIVGFLGNELVAWLQIRTGRKLGSDAMIADGLHARIDGLTSLAVLVAAVGTALGVPIIDPLIGVLIGVAILFIAKDASIRIWYRLMDAVDPVFVGQVEQYATEVAGVDEVQNVRARWVGHELYVELSLVVGDGQSTQATEAIAENVRALLRQHLPHITDIRIEFHSRLSATTTPPTTVQIGQSAVNILPPRYQLNTTVSAAPMGAAELKYDQLGQVAWDEIWTGFCDLALAGGPPHRGTLLEPVSAEAVAADPQAYDAVLQELERGLKLVTGLPVVGSATPGWIGLECTSEEMALWLLRAIVVENISVRREGQTLYFPAGPHFQVTREIKNVITVVAKTTHYWNEHAQTPGKHNSLL